MGVNGETGSEEHLHDVVHGLHHDDTLLQIRGQSLHYPPR